MKKHLEKDDCTRYPMCEVTANGFHECCLEERPMFWSTDYINSRLNIGGKKDE